MEKILAGEGLTEKEQKMYDSHPHIAARLLKHIPRIENVIKIIERQNVISHDINYETPDIVILGSQILNIALDLDRLMVSGNTLKGALAVLREKKEYPRQVIEKFESYSNLNAKEQFIIRDVRALDLHTGMQLEVDIKSAKGMLVAPKGQIITYPLLTRIKNFAEGIGVVEPIRIKLTVDDTRLADFSVTENTATDS